MSRFPAVTETFILRELCELERQGLDVTLVPLLRDEVPTLHREAEPWDMQGAYRDHIEERIKTENHLTTSGYGGQIVRA